MRGLVELKKRYLGGVYPGQLLCWCRIDVGINCVIVYRHDGSRTRQVKFYDDPSQVSVLKAKLRIYLENHRSTGRWFYERRVTKGEARLMIYYPSRTWLTPMRSWRAMALDLSSWL